MTEHDPTLPKSLRKTALTFATFGSYKEEQRLKEAADAIEQLEAENARLKAAREVVVEDAKEIAARLCDAMSKNAVSQEMVEDMLDCIEIRMAFGRPPTSEMYESFAQRARELGIEVDE